MMHHGSRLCVLNVTNNYDSRDTTALDCVLNVTNNYDSRDTTALDCVLNVTNNYDSRDTTALDCVFLGLGTMGLCYMEVCDIPML